MKGYVWPKTGDMQIVEQDGDATAYATSQEHPIALVALLRECPRGDGKPSLDVESHARGWLVHSRIGRGISCVDTDAFADAKFKATVLEGLTRAQREFDGELHPGRTPNDVQIGYKRGT